MPCLGWNKANHKDSNENKVGNASRDVVEGVCGRYDKKKSQNNFENGCLEVEWK